MRAGKIIVLFLCSLLLASCTNKSNPDRIKDEALEYLNETYKTYGDSFEITKFTGESWADDYEEIYVKSAKFDDTFQVRRRKKGKNIEFNDNYFTLYMKDEATSYMKGLVLEAGLDIQEVTVKFTEGERPSGLDSGFTFQDYVDMGGSPFFYADLVTTYEISEEKRLEFMELLEIKGFKCNVTFNAGE